VGWNTPGEPLGVIGGRGVECLTAPRSSRIRGLHGPIVAVSPLGCLRPPLQGIVVAGAQPWAPPASQSIWLQVGTQPGLLSQRRAARRDPRPHIYIFRH
jgi:hypothetical protein